MPVPALLAAIPSIFQGITGLSQLFGGQKQLNNLQRPEYKMPEEINAMLTLAQAQYQDPYSTENLNAQRQIGMGAANAVMAGRDSGNLAGILPAIVGQQNQGYNQAAQMMEATKERQMANLSNMLGIRAKYKDQEWQMNKFAPYQDQYNEARERIGAGQQNIFGALGGLSSIGQMLFSGQNQVAPADAAQFTSQQQNQSSLMSQMIQGYSDSVSYLGPSGTGDVMSYPGQQGVQNQYAGQFNNMLQLLTRNYPY